MNLRAISATPRKRASSRPSLRRALLVLLSGAIATTGVAFLPALAPAAQAAQPSFACDALYSVASASPHGISKIDAVAGTFTSNGSFSQGSSDNVNALALPAGGGRYIWGFNRQQNKVLRYDATSETTTQYTVPTNSTSTSVVAGAINPANGIFYYAVGGSSWTMYAFDTTTNTAIGQVATISATSGLASNGDMAFDALGNLYLTSNADTTAGGFLSRVTGTVPTTAGNAALGVSLLTTTPANSGQYTSIAIDDTGQLAIGTSTGKVLRVNPATGATISTVTVGLSLADLASCSVPSTGTVNVNLPSGRYANGDQFGVAITGGGVTSGNSGTTTGTDTGLQDESAEQGGAVITQRNTTYTVTQTASGTTNLGNYTTTWACKRVSDGTTLRSGTGNSGSYTSPTTAADVICTFTNTPLFPAITLTKSAGAVNDLDGNGPDVGDTVVYSYSVTNSGAVALSGVTVVDTKAGTITCPQTALAVGASMTCTNKTYTLTQADVDAGQVVAPATATGTSPTSAVVTDTKSTTTTITRTPSITIDQTASSIADTNSNGKQDAGDTVTYGHLVTNTGNVTLTGVNVTDPTLGTITCPKTTLAPGEAVTCTPKAYQLTQADVNAGTVATTATTTGTPPSGANVSDTDSTTVPVTRAPGIDLVLSGTAVTDVDANGIDPGDTITYTFKVTNTGNVTLNPITVSDPLLGAITCPSGAVAPGATITCTNKSYAITQADIDAGQVVNPVTATGVPPAGANVTDPDSVTTPIAQSPAIGIVKSASAIADTNSSGKQDAGDRITYSFKVTNTGNVTLSSIAVSDLKVSPITCPSGSLAPGASVTCTAPAYTITQADVDAGKVVNNATASGTSPQGVTVTGSDTVTTTITQQPAVKLVKTAGAINDVDSNGPDAGDTITYSYVVTNTGTTTLSSITTTDTLLGAVTCPSGSLAPGASVTCTPRTYTLTQADVNAGTVGSPATTTALSPANVQVSSTSSTTTPIPADPKIAVTKTASAIADTNGDGMQSAGDKITYSFTVTNTGNVTLNPATVTDQTVGAVTCPSGALQPGGTATCTSKVYTLTQADVTAGSVAGTATATGTPPTGANVTATASTTTPITSTPRIDLVKTASAINDVDGNGPDEGDKITYSFSVTNTGNVPLDPVTVTDTRVGAVTCPTGSLAPGATITCTDKAYTLTQADIDAGTVVGTATATGKPPTGAGVTDAETTTTPVGQTPAIRLVKNAGPIQDLDSNGPDAGDRITYSFTITNTGNTTMTNVKVTDPKVGTVTCPSGSLAPGASVTCTAADYVLTQDDVNAGKVDNTATAEATSPSGVKATDSSTTSTPIASGPAIDIDLTVGAINDLDANGPDVGDTLVYGYKVTNTGNVTLTNVTVTDPHFPAGVTCPTGPLAPGASVTCTSKTYTLTQADVDSGTVAGHAAVTGTSPTNVTVTDTDDVTTVVAASPLIKLVKTASSIADTNGSGKQDAGDKITYSFVVTNQGNVTLNPVTVTDTLLGSITCPSGALAPGASVTCTDKVYTLTQADVDAGVVASPATSKGTPPTGAQVTSTSAISTPVASAPAIKLVKTASSIADTNGSGKQDAGDKITYSFVVTNQGNVTLNPVTVTDTLLGSITCPSGALAPGASVTCTDKVYTLTQADVDAGVVASPATSKGTPPTGAQVTSTSATSTPITAKPSISIDKTASAINDVDGNGPDAGDKVTYSFVVTNTGNVTLDPVTVSDTTVGAVTCTSGALAPGASVTCTDKVHTLTQGDVDAGSVMGTATATGTAPGGAQVHASDDTTTPITGTPAIKLVKSASAITDVDGNGPDAGDQVTYGFVVTNTGAVTLNPVTVTDTLLGAITCPSGALAPGESITCTPRTYTLIQADVDAGSVGSPATATGTGPGGAQVTSTSSTTTPIAAAPRIRLGLSASAIADTNGNHLQDAGDTITYGFLVTNTGNVTLSPVTVSDPKLGAVVCPTGPLAPGASVTCTPKSWTLTQAEVTAGTVTNTATATGTAPNGAQVSDPDAVATPVTASPSIQLDLTASAVDDVDGNGTDAGDKITYSYTVTNTGNVPLQPVVVADPLAGPVTCPPGALAPGASVTCTSTTYTITQDDIEAGSVLNTSKATGTAPDGSKVDDPDSVATPLLGTPAIRLVKTASPIDDVDGNGPDAGDKVTYSFTVKNTGNLTLSSVDVTDTLLGAITCPTGALAPGDTMTCTDKVYTLTQADVTAGSVGSPATATGTTAGGAHVTSTDATNTPIPASPRVKVVKTASAINDVNANGPDAGDTVTYGFEVTNTGNVPLGQVHIVDPNVSPVVCPDDLLQPGDTMTCSPRVYTLTQADVNAGQVTNTATVDATSTGNPGGVTVTATDSKTVTIPQAPAIRITITPSAVVDLDGNGDDAGDRIDYTIKVANTGNVRLDDVVVTDPDLGPITCPKTTLAAGETMACTVVSHAVTTGDVAAGSYSTTATATGTSPQGTTVTDDDTATTPVVPTTTNITTSITVSDTHPHEGDTVTYTVTVTNNGSGAAKDVKLVDPLPGGVTFVSVDSGCTHVGNNVSCELGTLQPGESKVVTITATVDPLPTEEATYQHDIDVQKVEAQIDLEAGQTRTVTATCAPGYLVTDGSGRIDEVDQGTGSLASVHVIASHAVGDDTWSVTVVNDAEGRAQAKVFAVCVKSSTEAVHGHAHDLVESAPVTRTVALPGGQTQVALECGPGQSVIVPGYELNGEAVVLTSYPSTSAGGNAAWTFVVDTGQATSGTFALRCLDNQTTSAAGHRHGLDLSEVRQTVTVPAGETVEVQLTCADNAKGIVAGWDLDAGLVNLGNDPRPKTRAFKLYNPTSGPLDADLHLLCLGTRTVGSDLSGVVKNTATASTSTPETSYADNAASVTFTVATGTAAPRPVARPASSVARVGGAAVVTTSVACNDAGAVCTGTVLLRAVKSQRVDGVKVQRGQVLARATYRIGSGKVGQVTLHPTAAGKKALRSGSVKRASVVVGAKSRAVSLRR